MYPKNSQYPGRDVSPLRSASNMKPHHQHSGNNGRTYSQDDIQRIIRSLVEPKLNYLKQELDDRQHLIEVLNERLNQNDNRLSSQRQLIESLAKKQKQTPQVQSTIAQTINQILNDKIKQFWETISGQLKQISIKTLEQFQPKKYELHYEQEVERLKASIAESIDISRKKSNSYWLKIKEALGKINQKIAVNEKELTDTNIKIENFQSIRMKDRQSIHELQNGKRVVKKLIELRKSVDNLYENYQSILSLQKDFRRKLEGDSVMGEDNWAGENPSLINLTSQSNKLKSFGAIPSQHNIGGHEDLVALDYSREEPQQPQNDLHFDFAFEQFPNTLPIGYKSSKMDSEMLKGQQKYLKNDNRQSKEIVGMQKTSPNLFSSAHNHHNSSGNTLNNNPHVNKTSMNDQSQIFSINNSNPQMLHSRFQQLMPNSQNSTLVNMSLEQRKQMTHSIRDRLVELMGVKNIPKPLRVEVDDQINYLKTSDGNYIFDVKGNMFKTSQKDLQSLENEGLIVRKRKMARSQIGTNSPVEGKVKRTLV